MPVSSFDYKSDSIVGRAIRAGFPLLRFEPALEREYQDAHNQAWQPRVRLSVFLALGTTLGFALMDRLLLAPGSEREVPNLVRFGLQLPIVLACVFLTSKRFYARWYLPVINFGAPLFGLGSVVMVASATEMHAALLAARLVLVVFFFYFMLGLSFFSALRANVIVFFGYVSATALGYVPTELAIYTLYVQLCANLFAGAGSYLLERANRVSYLDRRLLSEVADHDGLTGLYNRGSFDEQARRLWDQAVRDRASIAVLMLDIDHFKAYNDRYGHQAGDDCLRQVAHAARRAAQRRPLDLVARYGGEELVAIFPGADIAHAESVARAIAKDVADLRIPHATSPVQSYVTVSVGVAAVVADHESSLETLLRQADLFLYAAKDQGRDCVMVHGIRAVPAIPGTGDELLQTAT